MQLTNLSNSTFLSGKISRTQEEMNTSVSRLSSGKRIAHASDDVAGLSVATHMVSRISGLRSAITNLAQASLLLQTADDALRNVNEILQRMSSLAVMSNGGAITSQERAYLQLEFSILKAEAKRTLDQAEFNSIPLFTVGSDATYIDPSLLEGDGDSDALNGNPSSLLDIEGFSTGTHSLNTSAGTIDGYVETYLNPLTGITEHWLLVGRGREGWTFDQFGQGDPASVSTGLGTPAAFAPAAYDAQTITSLMREASADMSNIEIRIKRAENLAGTNYQEARYRPETRSDSWLWTMSADDNHLGEFQIIQSSLGANFLDTTSSFRNTRVTPGSDAGNNYQRMVTGDQMAAPLNGIQGFGTRINATDGFNDATGFLYRNGDASNALPYTEMYIRFNPATTVVDDPVPTVFSDPRSVEGLVAWYDAADLDGDGTQEGVAESVLTGSNLTQWNDKADAAAQNMTQNSIALPQVISTMNGLPTVTITNNTRLAAATALPNITSEMQLFIVSKEATPDTGTPSTLLSLNGSASGSSTGVSAADRFRLNITTYNAGAAKSVNWYGGDSDLLSERSFIDDDDTGTGLQTQGVTTLLTAYKSVAENHNGVALNGGLYANDTPLAQAAHTTGGLVLGTFADGHEYSEILIFDRKLSASETAVVNQYLHEKWNVDRFLDQGLNRESAVFNLEYTIAANAIVSDVIGSAAVTHFQSDVSYSLANDYSGLFAINATTGEISLARADVLDAETLALYTLDVIAEGASLGTSRYHQGVEVTITPPILTDEDGVATAAGVNIIRFQVGNEADDVLEVITSGYNSEVLFGSAELSISTQEKAQAAFEVLQQSIDLTTQRRAYIGSKMASADILSAAQLSHLQNIDSARGVIADTDIASSSTDFALQTVRSNLSIAVSAQTNSLRQDTVMDILNNAL